MTSRNSHKVSVRIKKSLLDSMKDIWKEKYGGKGRSRWIDESVYDFLSNPSYGYQKANFMDSTDVDALQFVLELSEHGSLNKPDDKLGFKISEKGKSEESIVDPICNEKFTLSGDTMKVLTEAEENVIACRSHLNVKLPDPRGFIIRAAIEYAIVSDS